MLNLRSFFKKSILFRENFLFETNRAMSKNKKGKGGAKGSQNTSGSKSEEKDNSAVFIDKSNNILINILAKPGAKQNAITDITPEGVGVQINAPPAEGEANAELVRYISSLLGIRKGDVSLYKGFKSRQKTIKVEAGSLSVEDVRQKINNEISKE